MPPAPPAIPITYSYTKYDALGRVIESGEALLDPTLRGSALPLPVNQVNTAAFPSYGQRTYTRTTYNTPQTLNYLHQATRPQRYLRNRVSYTVTEANVATFYSYDPHGNVEWMASHIPGLGMNFVGYEYDLIGGKMLKVFYDSGMGDMFAHRYRYDEDNRLLTVETSRDGVLWDRDGEQEYFRHGPLRRLEIGEDSIQGIDYTYTIHGWLKGVNHSLLSNSADPGGDRTLNNGMKYPQDGYGMVLGYYQGDYARKNGGSYSIYNSKNDSEYPSIGNHLMGTNLYNGNISSWHHRSQSSVGLSYPSPVGQLYEYDVLNRLLQSKFRRSTGGGWGIGNPNNADYSEEFSYDPNGNIVSGKRHGKKDAGSGSTLIDNLTYQYDYSPTLNGGNRNRLRYVSDGVTTATTADIENQPGGPYPPGSPLPSAGSQNYEYDGSGNVVYDRYEGTLIKWNAQGKVAEVRKDKPGTIQTTKFWYNAAGNRVKKHVLNHMAGLENGTDTSSVTYYVRDANEAVMAIYQQKLSHSGYSENCRRKPNNGGVDIDMDGLVDVGCDKCSNGIPAMGGDSWNPWQEDYDGDQLGDACDPCPFIVGTVCGPQQPGLPPQAEVWNGMAMTTKLAELPIYGSERLGLMRPNVLRDTILYTGSIFTRRVDQKEYELKDHLGNIRVVVSDMKKRVDAVGTSYSVIVKSVNNYYAFGMLEEGMSGSSGDYRYGYNGKEMDNELKGTGNSVDYGERMYDPRLGRWGSVDPLEWKFPQVSSYSAMLNCPILIIDDDGRDVYYYDEDGILVMKILTNDNTHYGYKLTGVKVLNPEIQVQVIDARSSHWEKGGIMNSLVMDEIPEWLIPDEINTERIPDAYGLSLDVGFAFVGGANAGIEFVVLTNGPEQWNPIMFQKTGGSVGLELSAGISVYAAWAADPKYVSKEGYSGWFNAYSGGFGPVGVGFFWGEVGTEKDDPQKDYDPRQIWFKNPSWWGAAIGAGKSSTDGAKWSFQWYDPVDNFSYEKLWEKTSSENIYGSFGNEERPKSNPLNPPKPGTLGGQPKQGVPDAIPEKNN